MSDQDLRSAAFPRLDGAQMAALARCPLTELRRYEDGEKLFEAGERDLLVRRDQVRVRSRSSTNRAKHRGAIVVLGPGEFTGDVSQLTGGPAIVTGIARGDTEVYEVSPAALRRLLNDHPELGDVILRAFIARRHLLQESGEFVGLRVIGSRHSPETFRVREFLAKNHVPFTWFDTDADPDVSRLLQRLRVDRGRHARGGLGEQAAPPQALDPEARRRPGPPPAPERGGLRPRRGRGRTGGPGRGGLRRLRGPEDRGPRGRGPGRPGRPQHAHRELPRIPHRHHRRRAGRARRRAGQQVRRLAARRRPGHRIWHSSTGMPCSTSRAASRPRPAAC